MTGRPPKRYQQGPSASARLDETRELLGLGPATVPPLDPAIEEGTADLILGSRPPPATPSVHPPSHPPLLVRYGRYELLGKLAVGGMAEIFLAREPTADGAPRYLVIKRILPLIASDREFVQMFLHEARLAMQLAHEHICPVYELGRQDGSYFIAMEWIDGVSLQRLIARVRERGGLLAPEIAATILAQVADALDHAHRAVDDAGTPLRIVHRDVSPQNVMVGYDGAVKLLDFGVAKAATRPVLTQAGVVRGKFAYMSPEQIVGDEIDGRADVFALGTCLYEALTAQRLFHRPSEFEVMRAVISDRIPSVQEIDPSIPLALDGVLAQALVRNPEARVGTAGAFAASLRAAVGGDVPATQIAGLLETLFAEEIARGPVLDTSALEPVLGVPTRHFDDEPPKR